MSKKLIIICTALLLTIGAVVQADDDKIIIHGFGGWAYAKTDGNTYRGATEDGIWNYWDFGLNINAYISDDIRVNVQLFGDGYKRNDNLEIDYAFVEYALNENLSFRVGKIKQPFGIFGESKKVGIIRTFYDLPQSTYGHDFFTSDGYTGFGFIVDNFYHGDWGIYLHAYTGTWDGSITGPNVPFIIQRLIFKLPVPDQPLSVDLQTETTNAYGVYVSVDTPFNGMKIGGSAFRGDLSVGGTPEIENYIYNGFLEYNSDPFLFRGELSRVSFDVVEHYVFGYLEAGFKLSEYVQPVFRYEFDDRDDSVAHPFYDIFPNTAGTEEVAIGLNIFISPEFVLRASYHNVKDYQWAIPQTVEGYLSDIDTNMFIIGTQYSF